MPKNTDPAPPHAASSDRLEMILVGIRLLARDTNLYTFQAKDGGALPGAEPGAHIGLYLPNGMERQYSMVNSGQNLEEYSIGIKRDATSRGGSSYIHDNLRVGMVIPVAPPRNNFPLVEDARHVVLVAGGIGITPIYSMIRRLHALDRDWALHYCCRSRADAAFLQELEPLPQVTLYMDDERPGQLPPIAQIVAAAPADAHLYCCGPVPMLNTFEASAAARPRDLVHVEYFTQKYEAATGGGYVVELKRSGRVVPIKAGQSILHALRDIGVDLPSSCEEGVCGACETRVIAGQVDHRDAILSEAERKESATMMICCSGCKGDRLVLDI